MGVWVLRFEGIWSRKKASVILASRASGVRHLLESKPTYDDSGNCRQWLGHEDWRLGFRV